MAKKTLKQRKDEAELQMQVAYMNRVTSLLNNMPDFARDSDESKWTSLDTIKNKYTEHDLQDIRERAMDLYYESPAARGLVEMLIAFIIGSDAYITPKDKNEKVKVWWERFWDVNGFDMRMKEFVRRCFRDGEAFLRFFNNKTRDDVPLIRFVEPSRISDPTGTHTFGIETDPDDVENIKRYYLKEGGSIPAEQVIHTKINVDSNVKRGISYFVGICKYLMSYDEWLDDRIRLNKIRTLFSMVIKVTGITPQAFSQKFADSTGTALDGSSRKKLLKPGSVLVATPNIDYDFKSMNIHAPDTAADGRLIELQVGKGTGLTEYVVRADSSNSNYSSTMISEAPMVRIFEAWQDIYAKPFEQIFRKVIEVGMKFGKLPKKTDTDCEINFATLIHRDVKAESEACAIQIQSGLLSKRTASEKLGLNYETEQGRIKEEQDEESQAGFRREGDEE